MNAVQAERREAARETIRGLAERQRRNDLDYTEELLLAGAFLARFGAFLARFGPLGDLFEEPDLTRVQFVGGTSALSMLGHHSVEREDTKPQPPDWFEEHTHNCDVCRFLESCIGVYMMFEFEYCHECGVDVDEHDIVPDPFGNAFAPCRGEG